ncbi:MAG: hypothetical protein LUH53_10470 [Lachnospiraceae bacterium]|nr:hypothetical protein [Lachnospiraceae bacterium]
MMRFICKNAGAEQPEGRFWEGRTESIKRNGEGFEADVFGRGSHMHIIVGKYVSGNYVCIPGWGVGSPLAALDDRFWNKEQLSRHLGEIDAITLSEALCAIKKAELA